MLTASLLPISSYTQERNIARQYSTIPVVRDVIKTLESIRAMDLKFENTSIRDDLAKLKKAGLDKVLEKHLNVEKVLITYQVVDYANAYICTPRLDDNHLFNFSKAAEFDYASDQARLRFLKSKKIMRGTVDLQKVKLSGEFSSLHIDMGLTTALLKADSKVSADQVASIIFHEVGHLFTYYLYLGDMVSLSNTMSQLHSLYKGHLLKSVRVDILQYVKEDLELPEEFDVGVVAEYEDGDMVKTMVAAGFMQKTVSGTNSPWYDAATCERLADQFTARLGLSVPFAQALELMYVEDQPAIRRQQVRYAIGTTLLGIVTLGIVPLIMVLTYASQQPNERYMRYDNLKERIAQIRKDIVTSMKDPTLTKTQRLQLQEEHDSLVKVESNVKDNSMLSDRIWQRFSSVGRHHRRTKDFLTELENLATNTLFVKANKLQTLL